jgi:hypothetical protein
MILLNTYALSDGVTGVCSGRERPGVEASHKEGIVL